MRLMITTGLAAILLSGCITAAKTVVGVATLPVKATYHAGKAVGKGVVGVGKLAGSGAKATGEGVYYVGSIPVRITDRALSATTDMLVVTTQLVDATGRLIATTRTIQASQLDAELRSLEQAENVVSVFVDAAT
ncbi:hypothetical protein [uncultured Algimonas sp.]|uniref:hypothetical protein n=1 Tax=uncultured Algimonas sp. TaxID=1547920 RepID=UPI002610504A|nr:hypothetical protein [uncultured Algimonas sp.]